ncbi:DNA polymerase domain-containing protein [Chloroflexota bacterium]
MTIERTGWLLDVYPDNRVGVALWLLGEDGQRYHLRQPFPVTFYAAGPETRLNSLWRFLKKQPITMELSRVKRRELFHKDPLTLLSIQVAQTAAQPRLFHRVADAFPDLTYFDTDVALALRYAAVYDAFPLARCKIITDDDNLIQDIQVQDSPWDLDPNRPPLRIMRLQPDTNPAREQPNYVLVYFERFTYRLALQQERPLLINLRAILQRHDPDLLQTSWGDTWLLPHLIERSRALNIPLPVNRDPERGAAYRPEKTYFSYGQVIYRGKQVHLFGRLHVDCHNAMLYDDYDLEGVKEVARISALPLQTAARVSPGTAISSMQILTALRQDILVPWHKQQAERPKTAMDMFSADQGGLVYQPLVGLHRDVAGIDFVSMYPGIMVHFNISPETVGPSSPNANDLKPVESLLEDEQPGLVPQTLEPLLGKRIAFKNHLRNSPSWDPRRKAYKARSSAHKWLLVTCFGYLGYKNARFGRIESHEAVTAYGREALLRAKEAAEDLGYTVLHMYVDGLWVKKPGTATEGDLQPLMDAISRRTGLPIALDAIYRWVAFLPSRVDKRVPVPNRYFGVFQDGTIKVRGIEARRGDAPPFIVETQMQMLKILAESKPENLETCLNHILALLRRKLAELRLRQMPLKDLLVSQKLSRELDDYRVPSPPARAATQLRAVGKNLRAGQRVRFLYTLGKPGVYAWDLPEPPNPAAVNVARYKELLLRAASSVLEPFGMSESTLRERIYDYTQLTADALLNSGGLGNYALPSVA